MCTNVLLIKSHVNSGGAQKPRFSLGERSTSFLPIHDCVGFRSSAFSPASIYSSLQDCYFSQQKSIDAAQYSLQVNQCRLVGSCFSLHISQRKAAEILIVFPVGISPPPFFPLLHVSIYPADGTMWQPDDSFLLHMWPYAFLAYFNV